MDDLSSALTICTQRLLACPPFCGLGEHEVRDVKPDGSRAPRVYPCPERPILLVNLAGVLMFWESAQDSTIYMDSLNTDVAQLAAILEERVSLWKQLPQLGIHFGGQTSSHRATLQMADDLIQQWRQRPLEYRAQAGQQLPAAPYHTVRALTLQVVQLMAEDFRAFGPATFSQEAIYRAVAAILKACGVPSIQGKSWTAAGIKKLLARNPPTPDMYPRD